MSSEAVVKEHVKNMGLPESTGRHILDAKAVVEEYLKNQKEIALISQKAEASERTVKTEMQELNDEFYKKERELDDEKSRRQAALNNKLKTSEAETKEALNPLWERLNRVKRIIALLRITGTILPVLDIEDRDVTTYRGEYLEWLGCLYKGDYLTIRLLITENKKPKNKYSLLAYGRCAFEDQKILNRREVYSYGTPNVNDHAGGFLVKLELGSFPTIPDAKAYAQKSANKPLKQFIDDYVKLKAEYMEVTATYTLSDFEQITAQEKAKGGSQ